MLCLRNLMKLPANSHIKLLKVSPCSATQLHRLLSSGKNEKESNLVHVYKGSLTKQIKSVKVFSLSTSIAGLAAQPILVNQATQMGGGTGIIIAVCGFVGFFTFVTPLLLHLVTKKYVTEISYNPDKNEYLATIITFFLTKKQIPFKVEDVKVPDVPGMFTSFLVNKTPLFVDPKQFDDPNHYIKIMGYDKPIDFKLSFSEEQKEPKK